MAKKYVIAISTGIILSTALFFFLGGRYIFQLSKQYDELAERYGATIPTRNPYIIYGDRDSKAKYEAYQAKWTDWCDYKRDLVVVNYDIPSPLGLSDEGVGDQFSSLKRKVIFHSILFAVLIVSISLLILNRYKKKKDSSISTH